MDTSLSSLLEYINENNIKHLKGKIANIIVKYSTDKKAIALANSILEESININISELESLIDSTNIKFPKYEVGVIGIKNDE